MKGQANAVYINQKRRGMIRNHRLLRAKGGKCGHCGYDRCFRALTFHHRNPAEKAFPLDARNCSNRSEQELAAEAAKCDLLCMSSKCKGE
jgi:hypothetical protein